MRTTIIVILCSMLTLSFGMNIYQAVLANNVLLEVQDIHEHVEEMPTQDTEYQIKVEVDGLMLWDGNRYIGWLPYNNYESLHRMIRYDNSGR